MLNRDLFYSHPNKSANRYATLGKSPTIVVLKNPNRIEECRVMNSAKQPLLLTWKNPTCLSSISILTHQLIFKVGKLELIKLENIVVKNGDDMRQVILLYYWFEMILVLILGYADTTSNAYYGCYVEKVIILWMLTTTKIIFICTVFNQINTNKTKQSYEIFSRNHDYCLTLYEVLPMGRNVIHLTT